MTRGPVHDELLIRFLSLSFPSLPPLNSLPLTSGDQGAGKDPTSPLRNPPAGAVPANPVLLAPSAPGSSNPAALMPPEPRAMGVLVTSALSPGMHLGLLPAGTGPAGHPQAWEEAPSPSPSPAGTWRLLCSHDSELGAFRRDPGACRRPPSLPAGVWCPSCEDQALKLRVSAIQAQGSLTVVTSQPKPWGAPLCQPHRVWKQKSRLNLFHWWHLKWSQWDPGWGRGQGQGALPWQMVMV